MLLGKPIATIQTASERLTNAQGLAIFGADAMSSTAYATEEILLVLAAASVANFAISIWIALGIVALILIIAASYRQIIYAYPQGGGVYNVAKENLGKTASLVGGASLWVDYILTVAVSVTAGVAAITSAFPVLYPHRVILGIIVIIALMWANLRGVRESGKIFSFPTYLFIASFAVMIIYGAFHFVSGNFPEAVSKQSTTAATGSLGIISIILVLRAFASGCTAMTGIETTSNGVQAFKPPESKNAAKTLMWLAVILGFIFMGITLIAYWSKVTPVANETIISQVARNLFGSNPFYYFIQSITALILILAANTPFAGFPRVASMFAKDGYFPRQFYALGPRLVFTNGIIALSIAASLLVIFFRGNVHALIPLYAVGVFLGFSISQLGMIVHWKKSGKGHLKNISINAIGFLATSLVFIIVLFSKFMHGAWVLIPGVILIVFLMKKIKRHYLFLEETLSLDNLNNNAARGKTVVVLISQFNSAILQAVRFAKSLHFTRLRAIHVAIDIQSAEQLNERWTDYFPDVPLDIVSSEYRDLVEPLLLYLAETEKRWPDESLIVVIPTLVCHHFWEHLLHDASAQHIRKEIEQDMRNHAQILEIPIKPVHL